MFCLEMLVIKQFKSYLYICFYSLFDIVIFFFFSVMKFIEFFNNKMGVDESDGDVQFKFLEVFLLEKNKSLQFENIVLKVNNSDLLGRLSMLFEVLQFQLVIILYFDL